MGRSLFLIFVLFMGCSAQKPAASDGFIENYLTQRRAHSASKLLLNPENRVDLTGFCQNINKVFDRYHWKEVRCHPEEWKVGGKSVQNRPLIYAELGDVSNKEAKSSVIFCGVHGDEATSVYLCFSLRKLSKVLETFPGKKIAIVPLVNPDGFFKNPATRYNSRGVDLNRNFATKDWDSKAIKEWTKIYGSDSRKFPGRFPNSEPETIFQIAILDFYSPDKILSAHAPLRFIDYDGPADQTHFGLSRKQNRARYLAMNISKNSQYPLVDYPFFPGSLGNFAGQEKGIPTYTLELPSADPKKAEKIWERFEYTLSKAVKFDVDDGVGGSEMTSQED